MFKIKRTNLIILLTLIVALPVSLYLARHPQIFKGRATGHSEIVFLDQNNIPITQTSNRNVNLRLTYGTGSVPTQSGNDLCSINLTEGQTIRGDVPVVITGARPDPGNFLALFVANSRQDSFQILSTQSNILFANISSSQLFANGSGTFECRIQTEPGGGDIISSKSVNVNIQ